MGKGFICPKCSSITVGVTETRKLDGAIQRWRKCYKCYQTFKTYEVMADMIPTDPEFDFLFRKAPAQ